MNETKSIEQSEFMSMASGGIGFAFLASTSSNVVVDRLKRSSLVVLLKCNLHGYVVKNTKVYQSF